MMASKTTSTLRAAVARSIRPHSIVSLSRGYATELPKPSRPSYTSPAPSSRVEVDNLNEPHPPPHDSPSPQRRLPPLRNWLAVLAALVIIPTCFIGGSWVHEVTHDDPEEVKEKFRLAEEERLLKAKQTEQQFTNKTSTTATGKGAGAEAAISGSISSMWSSSSSSTQDREDEAERKRRRAQLEWELADVKQKLEDVRSRK